MPNVKCPECGSPGKVIPIGADDTVQGNGTWEITRFSCGRQEARDAEGKLSHDSPMMRIQRGYGWLQECRERKAMITARALQIVCGEHSICTGEDSGLLLKGLLKQAQQELANANGWTIEDD